MERIGEMRSTRGSATVEQVGLIALIGLIVVAGAGVVTGGLTPETGRGLAIRIANRIACGPIEPGPCRSHPAVEAYGDRLAKAIRALGPGPMVLTDGSGRRLLPVDFRYCRRPSCAEVGPSNPNLELTASNRRTTWFTEVERTIGGHQVTWWGWWPGIGWRATRRTIADRELGAHSSVRLTLADGIRLVPLESLDGRNHIRFGPDEAPPWQWTVPSNHESRTG